MILATTVLGCSGPANPTDFEMQEVDARCEAEASCGDIGRSEVNDCKAIGHQLDATAGFNGLYLVQAEKDGRISFDRDQANTCLDELRHWRCDKLRAFAYSTPCEAFHGRVKLGQVCQSTLECETGVCSFASGLGCGGTCVAGCVSVPCERSAKEGDDCKFQGQCETGLECVGETCRRVSGLEIGCAPSICDGGSYCKATPVDPDGGPSRDPMVLSCEPMPKLGEQCFGTCPVDQICAGTESGGAVCSALLDLDAGCDPAHSACPADAFCDDNSHTCVAGFFKEGDFCWAEEPCTQTGLSGYHLPLFCDANQTCRATKLPGEMCQVSDYDCTLGCDPDAGVCLSAPDCP